MPRPPECFVRASLDRWRPWVGVFTPEHRSRFCRATPPVPQSCAGTHVRAALNPVRVVSVWDKRTRMLVVFPITSASLVKLKKCVWLMLRKGGLLGRRYRQSCLWGSHGVHVCDVQKREEIFVFESTEIDKTRIIFQCEDISRQHGSIGLPDKMAFSVDNNTLRQTSQWMATQSCIGTG